MKHVTVKIWVTIFVLACIIALGLVNWIPRGNFVGAPFITMFIYAPLLLIQIFLVSRLWIVREIAPQRGGIIFYTSLTITIIFVYLMADYLLGTS
jgi:hypothetical protein